MSQTHHLKLIRFIETKGEAGCTEEDLNAFDQAAGGSPDYTLMAFELVAMGIFQHNWITRTYTLTPHGQRYKERIEHQASQKT